MKRIMMVAVMMIAAMAAPAHAQPKATATSLQSELAAAKAEIAAQRQQLEAQEARLRALEARFAEMASAPPSQAQVAAAKAQASKPAEPVTNQQSAIERVGERPISADRPPEVAVLGSEGSVVTRKGQLTTEFQLDYARADRNRALFRGIELAPAVLIGSFNISESHQDVITASGALRYGLTDRLEIAARVPLVRRSDSSVLTAVKTGTNGAAQELDSSTRGLGIGDVEISARYQLLSGKRGLPFLVGNMQVVAPTGTNPFTIPRDGQGQSTKAATGAGFWGVSPSLTAIVPSDPAVLFGTIGYTRNFGRGVSTTLPDIRIEYVKPGDSVSFSGGIGVALNERTSINFGYAHTWAFGTYTRSRLTNPAPGASDLVETKSRDLQLGRLLFGLSYRATDRASINWSVEIGSTEDATDVRTVLRLPLVLLSPRR